MSDRADYTLPTGIVGLTEAVAKPAPGTLPLRGDLAHIALAETHLAAHYVIPTIEHIGDRAANVFLLPRDDAQVTREFAAGTKVELLDIAGGWAWICIGPEGPSGYVKTDCLAATSQ